MSLNKHQLIPGESVMLRRIILTVTSMALGLISVSTFAGHATLEDCIKVVNGVKKGSIARVEFHNFSNEGKPAYELEIVDSQGTSWEFECDKHGNIVEIEQEVDSASDPLFKDRAKISEADAMATALKVYPGKNEKTEYEIEFDGAPSYEFNIESKDGTEFNIEVSAETGEIIEVSTEGWEIGTEE
jgi:uncharacterized membrane protein YkoI